MNKEGKPDYSELIARVSKLEERVENLAELLELTVRIQWHLMDQMEFIEQRDEELLFHQFTDRYYSEVLYGVKWEYQTEMARVDNLGKAILDIAIALPDELRDDIERRVRERTKVSQTAMSAPDTSMLVRIGKRDLMVTSVEL